MTVSLIEGTAVQRYMQVAAHLRDRIINGELPLGAAIPSEQQLAQQYGVSRETGRKAVAQLRLEGLVQTRKARGTYVIRIPERRVREVGPGASITARAPTAAEREHLTMPDGVWILVVQEGKGEPEIMDASRTEIHTS
jgi:GntR family transcriptional regulator